MELPVIVEDGWPGQKHFLQHNRTLIFFNRILNGFFYWPDISFCLPDPKLGRFGQHGSSHLVLAGPAWGTPEGVEVVSAAGSCIVYPAVFILASIFYEQ